MLRSRGRPQRPWNAPRARPATIGEFAGLCEKGLRSDRPFVIVAKVDASIPQDIRRKQSDGREDKYIFVRHVEETEGIVIMGPSEHN